MLAKLLVLGLNHGMIQISSLLQDDFRVIRTLSWPGMALLGPLDRRRDQDLVTPAVSSLATRIQGIQFLLSYAICFAGHIAKSVEQLACEHGPFLSPPMLIVPFMCCQVVWTVVARRLLCCHPDRLS